MVQPPAVIVRAILLYRAGSTVVCLHQHPHKEVSNVLGYDVMMAKTSLRDKNFQLHDNFMGLLLCMWSVVDQNVIRWCMTADQGPTEPRQSQVSP